MNAVASYGLTDLEQTRVSHIQRLAGAGAAGVDGLVAALVDPSWAVRRIVVENLASLGESAVPALCSILTGERANEASLAAAVDALVLSTGSVETAVLKMSASTDPAIVADVVQILGRRRHPTSIPTLISLSRHPNDNVAVGAIEALGRLGGKSAVEALIEVIGTGNFFRTFPAIDVLGRTGDPRAVEPLTKLLSNVNYLPEAARALGRTGDRTAIKPLLALLKSRSDAVVRLTATSLWELRQRYQEKTGDGAIVIDELIRANISSEQVRRVGRAMPGADVNEGVALCRLLGVIGNIEAAESLTAALDAEPAVAVSAADSLKKIGKDADENLMRALREGDSSRRRVLLPIVTRLAAAAEVVACLTDPDPEVRALACDSLARIGFAPSVAKIYQLLSDQNLRVVHSATAAIQSLGTREARLLAIESARSAHPIVRRSALRILGYFGDPGSLQPLLEGLGDADPRVKEAALQGLPYLEDPRAVEALIAETKSSVSRNRALAIRALGQIAKGSERTYSLLLRALSDRDPWVRYYACQSLGRVRYAAASTEVAQLLNDEAGQVRVAAVEALSHLDSSEAYQALRKAAGSDDPDVKRAALVGLGMARRAEDLPVILAAAAAPDVPTRLIALSAIVNFHVPAVLNALSAAGVDPDEQVRSAAIGFLAARPEQEATEVLIELLNHEATRERAKAALIVPGQSRIAGVLVALQSADDDMAAILISILTRIERPEAKGALLSAIKLENVAARRAAAIAFTSRRDADITGALREAAENDPDQAIRKICLMSLVD